MLGAPMIDDLPTLHTPRLTLRKLRLDDAADMFEYAQDHELALSGMWLPFETLQDSIDDLEEAIDNYAHHGALDWAIEYNANQKMIGRLGLHSYHLRDARAELSYAVNRAYWGQGIATEAAQAVLGFGFTTLRLHRVGAFVLWDNAASMRVLSKLGMQREGVRREATAIRGKHEDLINYSILRREWERLT